MTSALFIVSTVLINYVSVNMWQLQQGRNPFSTPIMSSHRLKQLCEHHEIIVSYEFHSISCTWLAASNIYFAPVSDALISGLKHDT